MSLQCGIVGLPNVGKSTLFSALTRTQVHTDTYPFTTIEPNVGIVAVPDDHLNRLADILRPDKIIPTTLRIVDIAGLIKGSHRGEGLGNQFLAQIREVDAIIHLVRCFTSKNVSHIAERLNPVRDIEIVQTEIILKDLETVTNHLEKVIRKTKSGDTEATKEKGLLEKLISNLYRGLPVGKMKLDEGERNAIRQLSLLTDKQVLYVGNVNEEEVTSHHPQTAAGELSNWGEENGEKVLILSVALEQELAFLEDEEERYFFMEEWELEESGLNLLVRDAYTLLDLITFYTTESNHAQAWTVKRGTHAPQAAGVIHTDFERGFIKADVYHCDDLLTHGSETALRKHGLVHTHGKDYIIEDGDVVKYKFNV